MQMDKNCQLIEQCEVEVEQGQNQQSFHLSDYEQASSESILVQFARHSYPLVGAIIDGSLIKGDFGYGEIQQPRNQRLVKLQNNKLSMIEQVQKIIITKSTLKKKQLNEQLKEKQDQPLNGQQIQQHQNHNQQQKNNPLQNKQQQEPLQQEERFFSQSSKSSGEQDRKERQNAANKIKKKNLIKKSAQQKNTSKLSKNVLKKKLKYLSSKR